MGRDRHFALIGWGLLWVEGRNRDDPSNESEGMTDRLMVVRIVTIGDIPCQGVVGLLGLLLIQRNGERKNVDI